MIAKAKSSALSGIEGRLVEVEADLSQGLPAFDIVGLPDAAVKEAKERVRAAIRNSGFAMPTKKAVINLAPADLKKEGSGYDLAIALSVLAADKTIDPIKLLDFSFYGELSLAGELKHINGILSLVLCAKEKGIKNVIVPKADAYEASLAEGVTVYGADNLYEVVKFLKGQGDLEITKTDISKLMQQSMNYGVDFSEVRGQHELKRVLEIAAAGGHNVVIMGPPGTGKSMLSKRLPTIMPDMTAQEAIETTRIYSAAGLLNESMPLMATRPFRSPHHNISMAGLIGGGSDSKPGEISLAHNGVLFLDEFLEFAPKSMEAMRQPLEDGRVTVVRAASKNTYPSKMMLILAANPCPCGYFGDPTRKCTCSSSAINRYLSKMSGPLLDRIDMQVEAFSLSYGVLSEEKGKSSAEIKESVTKAREIQRERFKSSVKLNSDMKTKEEFDLYCALDETSERLIESAFGQLGLSIRGYNSVLSVARTIADLEGSESIKAEHLGEAIKYRRLETKYWNR